MKITVGREDWPELAIGLVALLAAYIIGSFAIDNGSLWFYFGTGVSLWIAIREFVTIYRN